MADSIIVQDATINGKPVKLRASCDTCNESKVRCSHAKPRCARCERLRITCVYGLSRRSHKTAPRVGAASSSELGPAKDFPVFTPIASDQAQSDNLSFYAMFADPSADSIDVWNNFDSALNQTYDMGATAVGPIASLLSPESPSTASNSNQDTGDTLDTEQSENGPRIDGTPCSCTADLVKQLQSMPSSFEDQGVFLDIHLSRLRDAINVSQTCINCNCTTRDEMSMGKILFYNFQINLHISLSPASAWATHLVRDILEC